MDNLTRIGQLIEKARVEAGLSAREVAISSGVSPAYLRAIEQGRNPKTGRPSRPSPDALLGISRALGLDVNELLALAGHAQTTSPASEASDNLGGARPPDFHIRQIQDAVKSLNRRGSFLHNQALQRLEEFSADFQAMSAGTLRCLPEDEPFLTRLATHECRHHLRAVSFQDEVWWRSDAGDSYFDLHSELRTRGVKVTRIFLLEPAQVMDFYETLTKHVELDVETFVISPTRVPDHLWRDFVIYDEGLLRSAVSTDLVLDRKYAEFTDDPGRIASALDDFRSLQRLAVASDQNVHSVLARLGSPSKGAESVSGDKGRK